MGAAQTLWLQKYRENTFTVIIMCQQQLREAQNVEKAKAKEEYITSSKLCKLIHVHN